MTLIVMTKLDLGIRTLAFGVWMAVSSPRPYRKLDPASVLSPTFESDALGHSRTIAEHKSKIAERTMH